MARCFMTGVEFRVEDGYVINRTDACRLLRTLRKRAEGLERVLAQLSPLDTPAADRSSGKGARRSQHRMVCKAVAGALAHACPEIELFLSWTALCARNIEARMQLLREHPLYGPSISCLHHDELAPVTNLGQQVLRLIDPRRELSRRAQFAIRAGICMLHRAESATQVATLIRSTVFGKGDLTRLGVPPEEHDPVRASLTRVLCVQPPRPSGDVRD